MKTFEILAGTTTTGASGFVYRVHDGIQQHDYAWQTDKATLLKQIKQEQGNCFSIEFPVKSGCVTPFWTSKDANLGVVDFTTVTQEDQMFLTQHLRQKS